MNTERLLKLADFLDIVPADSFEMGSWVASDKHSSFNTEAPGTCGFAGCAMGWAAHAKMFPELSLWPDGDFRAFLYLGKPTDGFDAAEKLFDIPYAAALKLFDPEYYCEDEDEVDHISAAEVAQRIRAFVKGDGVIP